MILQFFGIGVIYKKDWNKKKRGEYKKKMAVRLSILLIALTLLFPVLAGSTARAQNMESLNLIEEGKELLGKEQYEQALYKFNRAVSLDPQSPKGHFYRGAALYWLKRYPEADKSLDEALKIDNRHYLIWYYKAKVTNARGDAKQALGYFEKSIENNTQFKDAWFEKGLILYAMKQYRPCASCMGRVVNLDTSDGRAYCILGMCQFWIGDMALARSYIEKGLLLNPAYREKIPDRIKKGLGL